MYLDRESEDSNHVYMCLPAAKHYKKKKKKKNQEYAGFPFPIHVILVLSSSLVILLILMLKLFMKKSGATTRPCGELCLVDP